MPKPSIDWARVRRLAANSFTGHGQSDADFAFMVEAHKRDPERYGKETAKVKTTERAKLNPLETD